MHLLVTAQNKQTTTQMFSILLPLTILHSTVTTICIAESEREGTRAETRIGLSAKRTSTFKSAGRSVQSTTGSRGVRMKDARLLATHCIRIFPLHFPSRASPCAVSFRFSSTTRLNIQELITLPVKCVYLFPTVLRTE